MAQRYKGNISDLGQIGGGWDVPELDDHFTIGKSLSQNLQGDFESLEEPKSSLLILIDHITIDGYYTGLMKKLCNGWDPGTEYPVGKVPKWMTDKTLPSIS